LEKDYKIEIGITPSYKDNKTQPYYWVLFAYHGAWCNVAAGWAETPEKAWGEAYTFYSRFKDAYCT